MTLEQYANLYRYGGYHSWHCFDNAYQYWIEHHPNDSNPFDEFLIWC